MEIGRQHLMLHIHTDVHLDGPYIVITTRTDPNNDGTTLHISLEALIDNQVNLLRDTPDLILGQLSALRQALQSAEERYARSATLQAGHPYSP